MQENQVDDGEIFQIKHHRTGEVLFEARLPAEIAGMPHGVKIGAAVKLAIKARAYLAGANLAGANLARADLTGAALTRANLAGAKGVIGAGQPNGFWAYGYCGISGGLRVKIGCRDRSMAEAREYWSPSHPNWGERQEIPAALDMIEAIARLRKWDVSQEQPTR